MNNLIQFAMESIRKEIKNEHNLLSIRTQSFFVDIFAENISSTLANVPSTRIKVMMRIGYGLL